MRDQIEKKANRGMHRPFVIKIKPNCQLKFFTKLDLPLHPSAAAFK
jgi:hypothetical protein